MKTVTLPGHTKPVSRIMLGATGVGLRNYKESETLLDNALRFGINALDTARVYGDSEDAVGRWMAERGNRESIFVLTKGAHPSDRHRVTPEDITADLMESLRRLQTDYVDAYLLHRDDETSAVGPIMDIFYEHYKAGRIRSFGGSNWRHQRIAEANAYAAAKNQPLITAVSPNYSLCDQVEDPWGGGCVSISGKAGAAGREFYKKNNIAVFAYSSLGGGVLSGRATRENYQEVLSGPAKKGYAYEINFARLDRARELAAKKGVSVPQISLAYLLNQPLRVIPLVAAVNEHELAEAAAATDILLTEEECAWLDNW